MFRCELKLEVLCETCPETYVERHRGHNAFGLSADTATYVDFCYELQFVHGWEVFNESYVSDLFYCPECKAKREAIAA